MNPTFTAFLAVLLDLGGYDVPAYSVVKRAFGVDLVSLTTGSGALHQLARKGYVRYEPNTDCVYVTKAGREAYAKVKAREAA